MEEFTETINSKNIKIKERKEPLVYLDENNILQDPIYHTWGISKEERIRLRSGVVVKLKITQETLNEIHTGYRLKVWDGFRTLDTQDILFWDYYNELYEKHPDWDHQQIIDAVNVFVSFPSEDLSAPSWHNTGGAVDLTIVDEHGQELDMGTEFDEFNERAFTDHFKNGEVHENRMLLKKVMEAAGFVNYPEEWWHYNYGDQLWAMQTKSDFAIYGSMEL